MITYFMDWNLHWLESNLNIFFWLEMWFIVNGKCTALISHLSPLLPGLQTVKSGTWTVDSVIVGKIDLAHKATAAQFTIVLSYTHQYKSYGLKVEERIIYEGGVNVLAKSAMVVLGSVLNIVEGGICMCLYRVVRCIYLIIPLQPIYAIEQLEVWEKPHRQWQWKTINKKRTQWNKKILTHCWRVFFFYYY